MNITTFCTKYGRCFLMIVLPVLFFLSCKKSDSAYDTLSKEMGGATTSYIYSGTAITLNGLAYPQKTDSYVAFPIYATSAVSAPDSVTVAIDTTLIATYNEVYHENNPMIRTNNFVPSNGGVFHFAANTSKTYDSLYVNIGDANGLKDSVTYLVPLRIRSKGNISLKSTVVFVKYKVALKSITASLSASIYNYSTTSSFSVYAAFSAPFVPSVSIYQKALTETGNPIRGFVIAKINAAFSTHELTVSAELANTDAMLQRYYQIRPSAIYSNYKLLPQGAIELQDVPVHIPAGKLVSADSLKFVIVKPNLLTAGVNYITGVTLKQDVNNATYGSPLDTTYQNKTLFIPINLYTY